MSSTSRIWWPPTVWEVLGAVGVVLTAVGLLVAFGWGPFDDTGERTEGTEPTEGTETAQWASSNGLTVPLSRADDVVVYIDQSPGQPILFSIRLDGSGKQRLWAIGSTLLPAMLPDGQFAVRDLNSGSEAESVVSSFSPTGERLDRLTDPRPPAFDSSPAVAEEARKLFFVRQDEVQITESTSTYSNPRVMSVPLDDPGAPEAVVGDVLAFSEIDVSADGTRVVGTCWPEIGTPGSICLYDVSDEEIVSLTDGTATPSRPSISDDGRFVVFSSVKSNPFGASQIWRVDLDGDRTPEMITRLPGRNSAPAISPDGECVLFSHVEEVDDDGSLLVVCEGMPQPAEVAQSGYLSAWYRS